MKVDCTSKYFFTVCGFKRLNHETLTPVFSVVLKQMLLPGVNRVTDKHEVCVFYWNSTVPSACERNAEPHP